MVRLACLALLVAMTSATSLDGPRWDLIDDPEHNPNEWSQTDDSPPVACDTEESCIEYYRNLITQFLDGLGSVRPTSFGPEPSMEPIDYDSNDIFDEEGRFRKRRSARNKDTRKNIAIDVDKFPTEGTEKMAATKSDKHVKALRKRSDLGFSNWKSGPVSPPLVGRDRPWFRGNAPLFLRTKKSAKSR